jgi:hypothetical protein
VGESWDRRQASEDRWRVALEEHNENTTAHSKARHQQTNDWIERFQKPMVEDHGELRDDVNTLMQFRAQVMLVGSLVVLVIGAGLGALFVKVFGI